MQITLKFTATRAHRELKEISCSEGPSLLHININSSSREDLSRPKTTALANKHEFMQSIKDGYL